MEAGNGELTRSTLRAELRAGLAEQTVAFKQEMDGRFKPVLEHIARIERGEFTPAQKGAILNVVEASKDRQIERRANRAPVIALVISVFALLATVVLTLSTSGVIQ